MLLFMPGLGASGLTDPSPAPSRTLLPYWLVPMPLQGPGGKVRHLEPGLGVLDRAGGCWEQGTVSWSGFGYKAVQGASQCHPEPPEFGAVGNCSLLLYI